MRAAILKGLRQHLDKQRRLKPQINAVLPAGAEEEPPDGEWSTLPAGVEPWRPARGAGVGARVGRVETRGSAWQPVGTRGGAPERAGASLALQVREVEPWGAL